MFKKFLNKLMELTDTTKLLVNLVIDEVDYLISLALLWRDAHRLERAIRPYGSLDALLTSHPEALKEVFGPDAEIEIHDLPE